MDIREVFGVGKQFVIGMVHCLPLPGTTGYGGSVEKIYAQAVQDALTLEESGVDAVIVENMGDSPFGVAMDLLTGIGFEYFAFYRQRQPVMLKLI